MKTLTALTLLAAAFFCGYANAATTFTFAASDGYTCPSYCLGFATSDPAHTVGYVNVQLNSVYAPSQYKITMSVDGVTYQGITYDPSTMFTLTAGSTSIAASVVFTTTRTCTHSGRGQTCTWRFHATSGAVGL